MIKKLCVLLVFIMALNFSFSMNIFGASYASLNKTRTVRNDVEPSDQYLRITPLNEVSTGSSIIITFSQAKTVSQQQIDGVYQYPHCVWTNSADGFWKVMPNLKTNELPYRIRRISTNSIQVYLMNLPGNRADRSLYSVNGINIRPVYYIRLPFITDGAGTMSIKIDNNDSSISSAVLSGYYVFDKRYADGRDKILGGFTNTEGSDGEILEPTTETTTAEPVTEAVTEELTEETTELDIFEMDYDELIAVRDVSDIITKDDELSYVDWDSDTKTVTISYKDTIVKFINEAPYYILNDEEIPLEDELLCAVIIDRRMYVPAGLVIDALGLEPPTEETTEGITETTTEEASEENAEASAEIGEAVAVSETAV